MIKKYKIFMYQTIKKNSIIIISTFLIYELLNYIYVDHFVPYIVLTVFLLFVIAYWKNSIYFFDRIGLYIFSILIAFCLHEFKTIYSVIFRQNLDLLKKFLVENDKIVIRMYKFHIMPILIYLLIFICININNILRKDNKSSNNLKLFESRKDVFKKIKKLLKFDNNVYSIGINAKYGSGKTFIIDLMKSDCKDIVFVDIYSLSANIDNIEKYIISEISLILKNNNVYIDNFAMLINNINSLKFLNVFENKRSITECFEELKDGIIKSRKNIVFIVDDLDRIYNPEIIYKIFNIFEKIKCNNVKILYLYDFVCLSKLIPYNKYNDKLNMTETKKFITKYISQEIVLPDPNLAELRIIDANNSEYNSKIINEQENIRY